MIRKAALAAVLIAAAGAARATAAPQEHQLPSGTAVVFVSDGRLGLDAKVGSVTTIHLRDDVTLEGSIVIPAGTKARLIVGGHPIVNGVRTATIISLDSFATRYGTLPIHATGTMPVIDVGATVSAVTDAPIIAQNGTYSIAIPFPFSLSNDQPAAAYTPTPARTPGGAPSPLPRRGRKPGPSPSPSGSPTPTAAPTDTPTPIAPEDVLPTPTVTIPPSAIVGPRGPKPTDSPFPILTPPPTATPKS